MKSQENQPKESDFPPIVGILMGLMGVRGAFHLYTILPNTKQEWLSLSLWIEMWFVAIVVLACFYGFLKAMKEIMELIKKKRKTKDL